MAVEEPVERTEAAADPETAEEPVGELSVEPEAAETPVSGKQDERVTGSLFWRCVVMFGGMALGYALAGGLTLLLGTLAPSLWDSAASLWACPVLDDTCS
jgi:hypothetical protein